MTTSIVEDERIRWRHEVEAVDGDVVGQSGGEVVVYWMQQAQRARHNPALEFAVQQANALGLPLFVVFCVVDDYPDASRRHYKFMLDGLAETQQHLARRGIGFAAVAGRPASTLGRLGPQTALTVFDRGYLPIQRRRRDDVVETITSDRPVPVVEVETDAVVPVDLVSDKTEVGARTIRPKIQRHLERFVVDFTTTPLDHHSVDARGDVVGWSGVPDDLAPLDLSDPDRVLDDLELEAEPAPVSGWPGGHSAASRLLDRFIDDVLPDYRARRQQYDRLPSSSMLSPYLHFGQISPVEIAFKVKSSSAPTDEVDAFIDELIVRRELAFNYVIHESDHDGFGGLPRWARQTLRDHADDEREEVLTAAQIEAGETPDDVWNAIMAEIRDRGWVHNQLRMYWGKQVLRWTNTPEYAFRVVLDLNNKYFLDGRDANSYANVAWCFGRHDQGFAERPVLGKVRPFTTQALKRKGDLNGWLASKSGT